MLPLRKEFQPDPWLSIPESFKRVGRGTLKAGNVEYWKKLISEGKYNLNAARNGQGPNSVPEMSLRLSYSKRFVYASSPVSPLGRLSSTPSTFSKPVAPLAGCITRHMHTKCKTSPASAKIWRRILEDRGTKRKEWGKRKDVGAMNLRWRATCDFSGCWQGNGGKTMRELLLCSSE